MSEVEKEENQVRDFSECFSIKFPYSPEHWVDADQRMFDACFIILGQFVENELGTTPWNSVDPEKDLYRGYRLHSCGGTDEKAIDLWIWYSKELPQLEEDVAEDFRNSYIIDKDATLGMRDNPNYERKYEYHHVEKVCNQKLKELIELRTSLWT